eukprot:5513973-Pyramimonas_sp.AAC.1
MTPATLFTDLHKIYERIAHSVLVREGMAAGFEYRILAAACSLYSGPRVLAFHGAVSEAFRVLGTVLAGCSLAMSLVKVLLYRTLTRVVEAHPAVHPRKVVDDISAQVLGTGRCVVQEMSEVGHKLVQGFQNLKLILSGTKGHFLAPSRSIADRLAKAWGAYGF